MCGDSLVPRLLPSFLSHIYCTKMRQKAGEEPGNEASVVIHMYTVQV